MGREIYPVLALVLFSLSLVYPVAGVLLQEGREIYPVLALILFSLSLVYPVASVLLLVGREIYLVLALACLSFCRRSVASGERDLPRSRAHLVLAIACLSCCRRSVTTGERDLPRSRDRLSILLQALGYYWGERSTSFSRSLVYPVAGVLLLVGREIYLVLAIAYLSCCRRSVASGERDLPRSLSRLSILLQAFCC